MSKKGHKVEICQCMACRMERREFVGENNPTKQFGVRENISKALKGRMFSEEHKEKLRGKIPWNKGLIAEMDKRVAKQGGDTKFKKGHVSWSKGLTKEIDNRIMMIAEKSSKTKKGKKIGRAHV